VHIDTRIRAVDVGVGQVLETVADGNMAVNVKINADVGGKLDGIPEIVTAELVIADKRLIDPHEDAGGFVKPGKVETRPHRTDKGGVLTGP